MRFHQIMRSGAAGPAALLWLVGILAAGCGGNNGLATGGGTVTLNGAPVEGATVEFQPQFPGGSASYGKTDAAGEYQLYFTRNQQGVMPGEHRVRIFYQVYDGDGAQANRSSVEIPSRYNTETELQVTVQDGSSQTFNFELKS